MNGRWFFLASTSAIFSHCCGVGSTPVGLCAQPGRRGGQGVCGRGRSGGLVLLHHQPICNHPLSSPPSCHSSPAGSRRPGRHPAARQGPQPPAQPPAALPCAARPPCSRTTEPSGAASRSASMPSKSRPMVSGSKYLKGNTNSAEGQHAVGRTQRVPCKGPAGAGWRRHATRCHGLCSQPPHRSAPAPLPPLLACTPSRPAPSPLRCSCGCPTWAAKCTQWSPPAGTWR